MSKGLKVMNQTVKFIEQMLEFLPEMKGEYLKSIEKNGEILETVVIENVLMPQVIRLLSENNECDLINRIFDYFEQVSCCGQEQLINNFSVTVLEILGNDSQILNIAQLYMGPETKLLQIEADRGLGRGSLHL